MKNPTASIVKEAACWTLWRIQWPSTPMKGGKTYYATTYPGSELVFIETAAKRRPISTTQGRRISPQIRDAIQRARAAA
jgi:hypothetical protein